MSVCCVPGCDNRYSPSSSIKFYRIPSGSRPFNANRRRLWVEALEKASGGSCVDLLGNVRVCGAHFISGEACMDPDRPDFVPSVFTCTKQSQSPNKKLKWFYGSQKRRCHRANAAAWKNIPVAHSPAELQSFVLMEMDAPQETEELSNPSELKEREIFCKEAKTETVQSQTSSIHSVRLSPVKAPASIQKINPIVLLKPLIAPSGCFHCERCIETFVDISELVKHKRIHEEQASFLSGETDLAKAQTVPTDQPLFPCNMCDRSFTTTQNLKRHKLLHVKDGRKCLRCGVLFCRRHNHVLFQPLPKRETMSEEDSFTDEEENLDDNASPEKNVPNIQKPTQITERVDNPQTTQTPPQITVVKIPPVPPIPELLPKAPPLTSYTRVSFLASVNLSKNPGISCQLKSPEPDYPPTFIQPHLPQQQKLPPTLKIFSPQYLTSALLEVTRNYEYIFSKAEAIKSVVKEEPEESVLISPLEETTKQAKREKIAYDLEVIL